MRSPLKSQAHAVGLPPDVSRKSTLNGFVPESEDGAWTVFPEKAALGALPVTTLPAVTVIPDLTGNVDAAETATLLPTMFEMTGVITLNVQLMATCAVSPISGDPSRSTSVNVGLGAVFTPATKGRLQLVADASPMISFWYLVFASLRFVWRATSEVGVQASGLLAAKLAAIRAMFWRLM